MYHAHTFSDLLFYLLVSEKRGHRKFRLTSRKNYERKKALKKATQASVVTQGGNNDEKQCTDSFHSTALSAFISIY